MEIPLHDAIIAWIAIFCMAFAVFVLPHRLDASIASAFGASALAMFLLIKSFAVKLSPHEKEPNSGGGWEKNLND